MTKAEAYEIPLPFLDTEYLISITSNELTWSIGIHWHIELDYIAGVEFTPDVTTIPRKIGLS